jgi:hypothetical protein
MALKKKDEGSMIIVRYGTGTGSKVGGIMVWYWYQYHNTIPGMLL